VEALQQFDWVTSIVLAADDVEKMKHLMSHHDLSKVTVILGGATRHSSIKAALLAIPGITFNKFGKGHYTNILSLGGCDVVVVHDVVRPFLPCGILRELVISAEQHGAAGPTRPLISTVIQPDKKGFLLNTLNRAQFLNSETPQAFRTSVLRDAYNKVSTEQVKIRKNIIFLIPQMTAEEEVHGTECLQLVSVHCNVQAKLIPGPEQLWKVTIPRDLHTCEGELSGNFLYY
jgi:D-ribitol-5-phosphate cytidylyltransferase